MLKENQNLHDTDASPLLVKARHLGFSKQEIEQLRNLYLLHPEEGENENRPKGKKTNSMT
ncbi:hypothetical protein MNBD_ALPHA12-1050 [hydrothermal vent metagenome]|uniref:Uncharacterized protein n=1 Tax=hydrothermal vent metagenome TaxID=652676 RepID=A0A3B0U1Y3_9ZZZZ